MVGLCKAIKKTVLIYWKNSSGQLQSITSLSDVKKGLEKAKGVCPETIQSSWGGGVFGSSSGGGGFDMCSGSSDILSSFICSIFGGGSSSTGGTITGPTFKGTTRKQSCPSYMESGEWQPFCDT
jgi:hypothetical protein